MVVINISLFNWSFFLSYPFAVLHKRDLHIRIWKSQADDDDNCDNNDDNHDDVVCFEAADNDLDDQGDQNNNHDENALEYEDDHDENTWKSPNIHLFEILALHHNHLGHNSSKKKSNGCSIYFWFENSMNMDDLGKEDKLEGSFMVMADYGEW